jgi:hypothetical protein
MYLAALSDHRIEDHVASEKFSVIAASGIGFLQYGMALSIPFFVELCLRLSMILSSASWMLF